MIRVNRVTLGDVCREYKGRADAMQTDSLPVVGLEHLSQSDIDLLGCSYGETTFTKGFRKGHVLFGRRRAYLKKASLAPYDGVCSGDIIVIEAVEGRLYPGLLPFIIQNDRLFDFAVENSAGSLSPRVKWKDLSRFEFGLPPMKEQEQLAELLWAGQETKRVYSKLLAACDEIVKSRFIEMFGDPIRGESRYERIPIGQLAKVSSGATPSRKRPEYYEGTIPWVKTGEVVAGDVYATEEHITQEAIENSACHLLPAETILVAMYGQGDTRGKAALLKIEATTNQACAALEFDQRIDPRFALTHLHLCYEDLRGLSHGGNQKNLSLQIIKAYSLIAPPIELQREFAAFVQQVDKSELREQMAVAA